MNWIISALVAVIIIGSGFYLLSSKPSTGSDSTMSDVVTSETAMENTAPKDVAGMTPTAPVNAPKENVAAPITKTKEITVKGVILKTNKGDIVIELDGKNTPNTAMNFAKLVEAKFYDGVKFHRVIKGFMIQGGDPLTKDDAQMSRWGTGGPGYQFADEIKPSNRNVPGSISMANSGPNTNGSQFFINVADNAFLDGKHTVFGMVTKGLDVVQAIEATPVAPGDRPVDAVVINSAVLLTE